MWQSWKHHAFAAAVLTLAGAGSIIGIKETVPGVLGTRAFGYGCLVLLSTALAIGPLARLWPRRLSRLLPYRRAAGIWSALAGAAHLLFALQFVSHPFTGSRKVIALFLREATKFDVRTGTPSTFYRLGIGDNLTVLAWTGLLALLLLLLLALISNNPAQRLLGQPAWKLLQQQAYTAMLLASLHILIMYFGGKQKMSPHLLWWAPWLLLGVLCLQIAGFVATIRRRAGNQGGSGK